MASLAPLRAALSLAARWFTNSCASRMVCCAPSGPSRRMRSARAESRVGFLVGRRLRFGTPAATSCREQVEVIAREPRLVRERGQRLHPSCIPRKAGFPRRRPRVRGSWMGGCSLGSRPRAGSSPSISMSGVHAVPRGDPVPFEVLLHGLLVRGMPLVPATDVTGPCPPRSESHRPGGAPWPHVSPLVIGASLGGVRAAGVGASGVNALGAMPSRSVTSLSSASVLNSPVRVLKNGLMPSPPTAGDRAYASRPFRSRGKGTASPWTRLAWSCRPL